MARDTWRTSDRHCNSLPLVPPSPPPSSNRRRRSARKLTSAATKRHIHLSRAAAFNHDRSCSWNEASSGPKSERKKKKAAWRVWSHGRFLCVISFLYGVSGFKVFLSPWRTTNCTQTHTYRKQILVVQRAATPFDPQRFPSCKILNIYGLQLKYLHSYSDNQEQRFSQSNQSQQGTTTQKISRFIKALAT